MSIAASATSIRTAAAPVSTVAALSELDTDDRWANPLACAIAAGGIRHETAGGTNLRRTSEPATELRDLGAVLSFVAIRHVGDQILEVVLRPVPGEDAGLTSLLERNPRQHLGGALVGLGVLGERLLRSLAASLLDLGIVEGLSPAHHQAERLRSFLTQDAGERISRRELI